MRALESKCAIFSSSDSKRTVAQLSTLSTAQKEGFLCNSTVLDLGNLVRCALEAKISADTRNPRGLKSPVLVIAAFRGHTLIVKQLLEAGADHSLTDSQGFSALDLAAQQGNVECVQLLLAAGADANKRNRVGETPIVKAIVNRRTECVWALLPVSDLLSTNVEGKNAFHACVMTANEASFEMLLPLVSDVDVRTLPGVEMSTGQALEFFNQSALHHACQFGQQQMAKALLKRGANRMARDSRQRTPCHYASQNGHLSCLTLLIGQPGRRKMTPTEVDAVDVIGATALHLAADSKGGLIKIAGVLVEAGARLDAKDSFGNTPLMVALQQHPTNTVLHALLSGASPAQPPGTVCDHCGKTAEQASVNGLKGCSECHAVRYCSAACSADAWKGHKKACRARAKEREEQAKPKIISLSSQ